MVLSVLQPGSIAAFDVASSLLDSGRSCSDWVVDPWVPWIMVSDIVLLSSQSSGGSNLQGRGIMMSCVLLSEVRPRDALYVYWRDESY